jgi:hypothetical protein
MSFSVSSLSSGSFISYLSGTNGVATLTSGSNLYYSANSGANWVLAQTVTNALFSYIGISGTNAVAMGKIVVAPPFDIRPIIYYSTDSGVTWNSYSTGPFGGPGVSFIEGSISGLNVICLIEDVFNNVSIFYSSDGGNTWNNSQYSSANFFFPSATNFASPDISGNNAIVCIGDNTSNNIFVSSDGGATFTNPLTLPPQTVYIINTVAISGSNALFAGYATSGFDPDYADGGFIYRSIDGGNFWGAPVISGITNVQFTTSDLNGSVGFVGGINISTNAAIIYSTSDITGSTWTPVTLSGNYFIFRSISGSGTNGLAAVEENISGNGVLFITTNSGTIWTQSTTLAANPINNVSLSNNNGIAGTSDGIYYTSSPLCYEKNTLILVLENEEEVYKKVSELKVGDLVKTYKNGYKKVILTRSFNYKPLDKNNELNFLYRMKDNGVIVTAGHSILVDELTEQEEVNNLKYYFNQTIEDKKLLLACASDKFEKIDDDLEYELYHFSLESDEPKAHFGVYINDGILSESCSEEALLRIL